MKMNAAIVITCGWMSFCLASSAQPAFEMNGRLGRGINMGNSFEAPTETAWGNPWHPSYFKRIAELGFNHVRVPVRWETDERSMASPPYTIENDFLNRIQEVVDSALRYQLHVIVNMHHHDLLFEEPAAQKERFLSQWDQIAEHFKDYPDSLLFEVLNEPHGNLTPPMWNDYFADALAEIRKTNPSRTVLMGVAEYGGLGGLSSLEIPEDEHLILTIHYYNPFSFTHQGAEWVSGADAWLGTEWMDTETDREAIASEFQYAIQFAETAGIPIHIGEFGAYSRADKLSRERWTTYLARWFEENGMSWAYWEFSAGFGIFNPVTEEYDESLVDALLYEEMLEPTPVIAQPVYVSDFSDDTDGWLLAAQAGAQGQQAVSGNTLTISIQEPGTEAWHLQLIKNNIALKEGKSYRIYFKARAAADRNVTFYAGRASSPWNAYSGYQGVSIGTEETSYGAVFNMRAPTDLVARLVFDLGTNTSAVQISEVRVDEISFAITSIDAYLLDETDVHIYPNPVSSRLQIHNADVYHTAEIGDVAGKSLINTKIIDGAATLDTQALPGGMYYLILKGNNLRLWKRVIKK